MAKLTIAQQIAETAADWQAAAAEGGHRALYALGQERGFATQARWPRVKAALLTLQPPIDYATLRREGREQAETARAEKVTHEVTLYSDAKASRNRYAITDAHGRPLWHGHFFENDPVHDQASGELVAAEKAVWLASKIAEAVGNGCVVRLNLQVDAEWLTWANNTDGRGGQAQVLRKAARSRNILLRVDWIAGHKNPADKYTVTRGYKKWRDNNLAALAEPIDHEPEVAA